MRHPSVVSASQSHILYITKLGWVLEGLVVGSSDSAPAHSTIFGIDIFIQNLKRISSSRNYTEYTNNDTYNCTIDR